MIIWVNGCFDVLHRGHFELLNYARSLGSMLIVGIDTDRKVRADKGPDRPIYPLEDRKYQLSSLKAVDVIHTFDSRQELEELIKIINPDILVVGSDWKNGDVVGREYAKKVEFFDRIGDYSTTKTIQGHRYR